MNSNRIHKRAARLERVVEALRGHAHTYEKGSRPRPLMASLRAYEDELEAIRDHAGGGRPPAGTRSPGEGATPQPSAADDDDPWSLDPLSPLP